MRIGRTSLLCSMVAGWLGTGTAGAAVIANFNDYTEGELVGQPAGTGTKWTGTSGTLAVSPAAGGGNEIVVSSTAGNSVTVSYTPTGIEQGGVSNTLIGQQTFSFDYRIVTTDSATADAFRLWLGTSTANHAVEINFRRNDVKLNTSTTTLAASLTSGDTYTIYGVIDYTTKLYDIAIRTSAGTVLNSLTGRGFDGADPTAFSGFRLNTRDTGANDRIAFDNMVLSVPEPASAGLLSVAGMLVLRRRRHG